MFFTLVVLEILSVKSFVITPRFSFLGEGSAYTRLNFLTLLMPSGSVQYSEGSLLAKQCWDTLFSKVGLCGNMSWRCNQVVCVKHSSVK